jgi:hypothetical protein
MSTVQRYDMLEIKAVVSPEGWIKDRPVLTRAGIFEYRRPDGKVIKEYRPEAEVFHADSLGSLSGIPITNGHKGMVSASVPTPIIGAVLSPGVQQGRDMVADIVIHNTAALGSRRELSLGYTAQMDETPGTWEGQSYDAIQKNIRHNHLAVVDKGRAGNARLRLDSGDAVHGNFTTEEEEMPDPIPNLVSVRLDEIEYKAAPEVARAIGKLQTQVADIQKKYDGIEAERDDLKKKVGDHETELKKVREGAKEDLRTRLGLEQQAEQLQIKFDAADSDRLIQEKVVKKLRGDMKFDGKSDDYVASAYDLAVADHKEKGKKVGEQRKTMDSADSKPAQQNGGASAARQRMLGRIYRGPEESAA